MLCCGLVLPLLTQAPDLGTVLVLAALLGSTQAPLFPSITALIANQVDRQHLGTGMWLHGSLNNAAKFPAPSWAIS